MKIKQKLIAVFLTLASLVGCVGYLAVNRIHRMTEGVIQINKSTISELESSTEMGFEFVIIGDLLKGYSHQITKDSATTDMQIAKLEEAFIRFEKALEQRKSATANGFQFYAGELLKSEMEELNKLIDLEKSFITYKSDISKSINGHRNGSDLEKKLYDNEWKQRASLLGEKVDFFKKVAQEEITSETADVIIEAKKSKNLILIITTLALVLAIVTGISTGRSILIPILTLKAAAENISLGKTDLITNIQAKDEIGDLTISFNMMATNLASSRKKLERYNITLEEKVDERTKALEENIQKLKETEKKLKDYATALKVSNMELEQFAYVASHDLQEPLRTCSTFVELLQTQYNKQLDDRANKYLGFITQSSDRMIVLIKDLLDFSRIGSKKELRDIDCNTIFEEVLIDLSSAINESKASIKCDLLPVINGYPSEIRMLFQNLIINAIKFRKLDSPPEIKISAKPKPDCWEFSCKDNGIGIDEGNQERIFIIFQRLHTRTEYKGSGIGLAHCKKIVELHGGKIWIDSSLGKGATFHFTILKDNNL